MSTARTTELTLSSRANAFVALTKPDVSFLVLMTTAAGYYMGARGPLNWLHMLHTVFATMLIAAGTATLNHYIERDSDRFMRRTAGRPLPTGVVQPREALFSAWPYQLPEPWIFISLGACWPAASGHAHLSQLSACLHSTEEAHRVGHFRRRVSRRRPADDRLGGGQRLA